MSLLGNELYIYCLGHILALFGRFWRGGGEGLHVYIYLYIYLCMSVYTLSDFYNHAGFIVGGLGPFSPTGDT